MTNCVTCNNHFKVVVGQRKTEPCPNCKKVIAYSKMDRNTLLARILVALESLNKT